jgi:hypothetical protein
MVKEIEKRKEFYRKMRKAIEKNLIVNIEGLRNARLDSYTMT